MLKQIGDALIKLRSDNLVRLSAATTPAASTSDIPPDFSKLIADPQMQQILKGRWIECTSCIAANAPLAATVMMGGLLEGLLLARINRETNKAPIGQRISVSCCVIIETTFTLTRSLHTESL